MKVNLGCGNFPKEGFINVDVNSPYAQMKWDLNYIPYPFEENSIDLIEADHVLEHLSDPFKVMKELHRILKPNGLLLIRVPHFSRGFTHADHKRGFDVSFPLYFDKRFEGGFCGTEFELLEVRFSWFSQTYLKKMTLSSYLYYTSVFFGKVFDFFANLSPVFCSRIWCFWVGGFEEIKYTFRKKEAKK